MNQLALHSKRVITPNGIKEATIFIKDKRVKDIICGKVNNPDYPLTSYDNHVIMPGLIDPHVHINEPGRTHWEGFETASKAALAGGITTLVDMPLNSSPVTTNVEALELKMEAARGKMHVNCHFWGGLIPGNLEQIEPLIEKGVLGFKVFLVDSGLDEFPYIQEADLREGMKIIAKHGLPLLAHCELESSHEGLEFFKKNPKSYQAFLNSRPKSWENEAVRLMIKLCKETGCRTHIVHLSSAEVLPEIIQAKASGLPLTVETCPQYLYFNAEEIPDAQVAYKCCPPIRERANNEQLWQAVEEGHFDFIATDHSPAPPDIKEPASGNLLKAWGGIASLQFLLPVIWTKARQRGFSLDMLSKLLSTNAADFIGMGDKKGRIAVGYDADLVVWDPAASFVVTQELIEHRHKITPYLSERLYGVVKAVYC